MIIWDCINSYFEKQAKSSNEQKEAIIAAALATDEGRAALAQSMVEPIRKRLEYSNLGRQVRLFPPDDPKSPGPICQMCANPDLDNGQCYSCNKGKSL